MTNDLGLQAEIDRLLPHYQSNTAHDAGRRQMLEHFTTYLAAATSAKTVGELVTVGYLFRLRYGPDHWSQQLMYSQTLPKEGDYKEVTPLVSKDEAASRIQSLTAAQEQIVRLREALEPMAEVASDIPDNWSDDHQCITACGHFRRAKAALSTPQGDKP